MIWKQAPAKVVLQKQAVLDEKLGQPKSCNLSMIRMACALININE